MIVRGLNYFQADQKNIRVPETAINGSGRRTAVVIRGISIGSADTSVNTVIAVV